MGDRPRDVERVFRGALLRVCREMGKETWKSFCFLYDIPERVREGGRSDVLEHLLTSQKISSERPGEFAEQLHTNLDHKNLADKFFEFMSEGEAVVEAREGVNRRPNGDDRRYARHLTVSQVPDLPESASLREAVGEEGPEPQTAPDDFAPVKRPRASRIVGADRQRYAPYRHDSIISTSSSRSSGYFSQRNSTASHYEGDLESTQQVPEPAEQGEREGDAKLYRQDSFPRSPSYTSSSSSSMEEEFHSGLSSSLSSLSTIDGSLPRGFAAGAHSEYDIPSSLTPTPERRKTGTAPDNVVASPTHTTVKKIDTIILSLRNIISDIDNRLKNRAYCSMGSPVRHSHGIDFKMKFSPLNPQDTGSCSLNVEVRSHFDKKVIPPLDISVFVMESNDASLAKDLSLGEEKNWLAHEQRPMRGNNLVIQGRFTALFPKLLDHQKLRQVSSEFVAIQVVMEYSTTVHPTT